MRKIGINTYKKRRVRKNNRHSLVQSHKMLYLGSYLRKLRQDLGFSLRNVHDISSISPAHLCKIEKGTTFQSVGIDVLVRLATAYNIPLSAILEEAGLIEEPLADLPELAQYLRVKYNLSPQAIRDLETAKAVVDKKYVRKNNTQPRLF